MHTKRGTPPSPFAIRDAEMDPSPRDAVVTALLGDHSTPLSVEGWESQTPYWGVLARPNLSCWPWVALSPAAPHPRN